MHRFLTCRWHRERDERGAVAIFVAAALTGILIITAMVLDFGIVRIDRQVDRAAADEATLAGLHSLNTGDGAPHPYVGVCSAIRYLQVNSPRFSGVDETSGWTDGLGAATANGCTTVALRNKVCKGTDKTSWAKLALGGDGGRPLPRRHHRERLRPRRQQRLDRGLPAGHERGQRGRRVQRAATTSPSRSGRAGRPVSAAWPPPRT